MKRPIPSHILQGKAALKSVMQDQLSAIAGDIIAQVIGRARRLTQARLLEAIKNVQTPGVATYKGILRTGLSVVAQDALVQVRKEVPNAKHVFLAKKRLEADPTIWEDLPPEIRKRIQAEVDLTIGSQIKDLEDSIYFQFTSSYDSVDSMDVIKNDLEGAAEDYIGGASIDAGCGIMAATTINDARQAFFMDQDTLDQIDALQFVNGDPVTTICQKLDGVVFDAEDPLAGRFQPPFHWNCKTYIIAILVGNMGKKEIEPLSDYSNLESEMQFTENQSKTLYLLADMNGHRHSA